MQQRQVLMAGLFGFMAVGLCLLAASQVQAASSNGPYYAEPSWSQKLPAATRFVVLLDWNSEAVLDRETGLVWERSPRTTKAEWGIARYRCLNSAIGGRMGWRLPSVHELASLIDPTQSQPTLPLGHPFTDIQSAFYWSATTIVGSLGNINGVQFFNGLIGGGAASTDQHIWCVRGSNNADAY